MIPPHKHIYSVSYCPISSEETSVECSYVIIMINKLFGSNSKTFQTKTFLFYGIKGQERWAKLRQYGYPWHLETWGTTTPRSRLVKKVLVLLSYVNIHPYAICRDINVYQNSIYYKISLRFHNLGIFLGSPGPNRKIVVFGMRENQGYFIKVPISQKSSELLKNEVFALNFLSKNRSTENLIPKFEFYEGLLVTRDVRSSRSTKLIASKNVYEVYNKLYSASSHTIALSHLLSKNFSKEFLIKLKNNEVSNPIICNLAHKIIEFCDNTLDLEATVNVYKAHGDLTAWNMFIDNSGQPKIIDLEMFGEQPEFFDLIHYFCSYEILVKKSPKEQIFDNLKLSLNDYIPKTQFKFNFLLYILRQSIIYCEIFNQQDDLHPQAFWQLETWNHMINSLADMRVDKE